MDLDITTGQMREFADWLNNLGVISVEEYLEEVGYTCCQNCISYEVNPITEAWYEFKVWCFELGIDYINSR